MFASIVVYGNGDWETSSMDSFVDFHLEYLNLGLLAYVKECYEVFT